MVDNDVIKYLIQKFEDKIRSNPLSPEFVKLANYYLINGNVTQAISLLQSGLQFYPNYTTAKLVLGKCYLANKYFFDAKKIFSDIIAEHPDMSIAVKYHEIADELTKSEVSRKHGDDIITYCTKYGIIRLVMSSKNVSFELLALPSGGTFILHLIEQSY